MADQVADASGHDPPSAPEPPDGGSRLTGYSAFLVAALVLGLTTWPIAFAVGAYGVVLYGDVFRLLVASTVAFLATWAAPPGTRARRWWSRLLLALPACWVILAVAATDSVAAATTAPVLGGLALVIALASTPYVIYLLATTLVPSLRRMRDRRLVLGLIGITVAVALAGWLAGAFNDRLLTCHDFEVAGDYQPSNCAK